ncbi:hypothetical protein DV515_00013029 [Chloebia gouldiae]|uniref:Uncharacterized protein n=1 Tax=Chloebia gouldiae TaxID=44316 RepID=A0A3L8S273_CHLGU|nr:hypothetical protein DV515_00013029 [Chloebia gouldiae]
MILMEFKMGTGQHGASAGSGASKESKRRVCGAIPAAPRGLLRGFICAACGEPSSLRKPCANPTSSTSGEPRCALLLLCLEQTALRCLFCSCAFCIVTAREEELDGRNALSRIPHKHFLFLLSCALFGFHHKAATLRLFKGLRLIYCPFLSLCNALQEASEATSDPCEDKMHRSGTCLVPDVESGHQEITAALSHIVSSSGTHFCEPGSSIPRFFRAPWRNLALALGKWLLHVHELHGSLIW